MNPDQPKLMELSEDGQPFKPEEIEEVPIVILDSHDVVTGDGRQSAQWVVRTPDQRVRLFWCAGAGPMRQVQQWFKANPGLPLHGWLDRTQSSAGYNVWRLTQRDTTTEMVDDKVPF